MQKGDAILLPGDHVLMFDYWVDSDHFMEYAEHDYGQVTFVMVCLCVGV